MALGKLKYEPAIDQMVELFLSSERDDFLFGLLDHFANVDLKDCREILREALDQLSDPFEIEVVALSLLRHFRHRDVELIVNSCLAKALEAGPTDRFLQGIATVLSGEEYFRYITEGQANILEQPKECIDHLFNDNLSTSPPADLLPDLIKALADGRFAEFASMVMFAAKTIVQKRYQEKTLDDWLL